MSSVMIDRSLVVDLPAGKIFLRMRNGSGANRATGDVVVLDTAGTRGDQFTTTTTGDDPKAFGMCAQAILDGEEGLVQIFGFTADLKVNGTTDIVIGDAIATYTTAGIGQKATAGKGGIIAYALEGYTTNDSSGVIDAFLVFPTHMDASATVTYGTAGQMADGFASSGSNGAGTTDATARIDHKHEADFNDARVDFDADEDTSVRASADDVLTWEFVGTDKFQMDGVNNVFDFAVGGASHRIRLDLNAANDTSIRAATETSVDVEIGGADEYVFGTADLDMKSNRLLNAGYIEFDADTLPAGTLVYAGHDNAGDITLNALSTKSVNFAVAGTDEATLSATIFDLKGNDVDNAGYVEFNATTLPAGTLVYAGHDNTGDLTLNALTGKDVNFAVNGTDEARVKADELELVSATNLQFLGDDDIVDSGGNELITFSATASATNGFQVKNAATGDPPAFGSNGSGATANRGWELLDSNGNEVIELISTASAVNGIRVVNSATTVKPIITNEGEADTGIVLANYDGTNTEELLELVATASGVNHLKITNKATGTDVEISSAGTGADANAGMAFVTGGTGVFSFNSGTDPVVLKLMGAAGGVNNHITDLNGNKLLTLSPTTSSVNYLDILPGAAGANAQIRSNQSGAEANAGITLIMAGTGALVLDNSTDPVALQFLGAAGAFNNEILDVNGNEILALQGVASAVNEVTLVNAVTTAAPAIGTQGGDADIDLRFSPKGAGLLDVNYAVVALGGGAAATLGTIGGSGPGTAGQNSWLKFKVQGTATFLALWR